MTVNFSAARVRIRATGDGYSLVSGTGSPIIPVISTIRGNHRVIGTISTNVILKSSASGKVTLSGTTHDVISITSKGFGYFGYYSSSNNTITINSVAAGTTSVI